MPAIRESFSSRASTSDPADESDSSREILSFKLRRAVDQLRNEEVGPLDDDDAIVKSEPASEKIVPR
jgi:hypothetical protein